MMVQFKKNGCLLILRSKVSLCFYSNLECIYIEEEKTMAPTPEQQEDAHSQWLRSSALAICAHVCEVQLREHSPVAIMLLRLPMDHVIFSSFCSDFVSWSPFITGEEKVLESFL